MGKLGQLTQTFLFWTLGLTLGGYMLFPYLEAEGFGTLEMLVFFALAYVVPFLMLLPLKKLTAEKSLFWGFASTSVAYFCLGFFGGVLGLFLWIVFAGASFTLFWVPFNGLWFKHKKWGNAVHGATYYGIIFTIGIFGPMVAGFLVAETAYSTLFYLSAAILAIGAIVSRGLGKGAEERRLNLKQGIDAISGFKTLFLLEGIGMIGCQVILFLITLEYFSEPLEFGLFLGSTTLIAVLLSLIFAKISDSKQRRREFIVVGSAGFGASLLLASFSYDVAWWFVAVVLVGLFRSLFPPFPMALLADKKKDIQAAMYGREILFNFARGTFLALSVLLYYFLGDLRIPLFLTGIAMLAYPAIFELAKRKKIGLN